MMPNSIFSDDKKNLSIDPQNHKTAYLTFPEGDKIKVHEADGICYDGDIENFKWQISILPDCSQYSEINKSILINIASGNSVNEIEPFIQSLNIGDILYAIVTMASFNETAKPIRYSHQGTITNLEGSLVAALQDRLLIIPKKKQNRVEIPYSEIKKIDQHSEGVAGGFRFNHISIESFDGNKIKFHLSKAVSSNLHFLERHKRLVYWIRKNIGRSAASSADEPKLEYQWMSETIPSSEEESRYENLSIKDLKGILRKRGLSVGGNLSNEEEYKLELIARLKGKEESFSLEPWKTGDRTFYDSKPIDEKDIPEIVNLQSKYKSKHTSGYFKSSKPQSSVYPLYLYLSLFLLFFMIFSVVYEMVDTLMYEEKSYSDNQVLFNRLFILIFVVLFVAVKWKTDDLQLNVRPYHTVVLTNVFTIIMVVSILVWFFYALNDPLVNNIHSFFQTLSSVGCCGSTIFLISIAAIFSSVPTQNDILVAEQERFIFESKSRRILFDTIKCENHGYLDRAKKLWMSAYFDEDNYPEEVERLEKFEVEIEYVRVKRRISNLKEKGVNCEKLENKLFQESLLKSFGLVESSDSDTINQEQ